MTDDDKVVRLQLEELRIQKAYEDLRDDSETEQQAACDAFEGHFGADMARRLRDKLGLTENEVIDAAIEAAAPIRRRENETPQEADEVEFHESDLAPEPEPPPTIEERDRMLEELANLWNDDPLAYALRRKEVADRLAVNQVAIDRAVKLIRDKRPEETEQSQATKIMALGLGENVRLWHSLNGMGHASVRVDEHWENYRIKSSAFEAWVRGEYGRTNQVKIGERWVDQVPGAQAVRDAMANLDGYAQRQGEGFKVFTRVGGNSNEIWLDLGTREWNAVRVTAEGWRIVPHAEVAFVRSATMLSLPIPVKGGSTHDLRSVLNVKPWEFVLVAGWLLQTWNPVGDYPFLNLYGQSEWGKSFTCNALLRTVDPRTTELRKPKKPDDMLIAARNNWIVGFDNLSWMTRDFSDTLCMIATGISVSGRKLYTDDEEHTYTVRQPVIFNGIPDVIEQSDLVSRTIKLEVPPLGQRRTKTDLEREFERIWPGVLGALLDGAVGGLAGQAAIKVDDPARLMDFEQFAEAGCRAMGFEEGEFVEAYRANRHGSMEVSAEASAVGRAVMAFMKKHPEGFQGQMATLYSKLLPYSYMSGGQQRKDWPKDPTRLSNELNRVIRPLASVGITCVKRVDRRDVGGTQKDVSLRYTNPPKATVVEFKKRV
jgi:hypothetical protein